MVNFFTKISHIFYFKNFSFILWECDCSPTACNHEKNISSNLVPISGYVVWSYDETICLIVSTAIHISDFSDLRKRKNVFENIANDLISAGYTINATQVQYNWKSLTRSCNKAKDTKNELVMAHQDLCFLRRWKISWEISPVINATIL